MTKYYCKSNWRIPGCAHTMCSFWDTSFVFQISVLIIHLLISLFLILSFIPFIEYMALQERKRWVNPYVSSMLIRIISVQFSLVQLLSHLWLFATPWTTAHQASLSITNSRSLPNSCPLSQWCHPPISSSVSPFSSCPQSLPASGSFPTSQLFAWGGQSIVYMSPNNQSLVDVYNEVLEGFGGSDTDVESLKDL